MRIEVVGDGHVFQGTPKQILTQMKSLAFGAEHQTLRESSRTTSLSHAEIRLP
jgi:hypothetical protein